jgi:UDP-glucose 4-epimerase
LSILVTGGAGYIGSHTVLKLLERGESVVVLDNFCNSKKLVLERIQTIAKAMPDLVVGDVRDRALVRSVFNAHKVESVIHFAGLKSVGNSVAAPLDTYDNNVTGSLTLIEEMERADVRKMVFSSSATVYGNASAPPFSESSPLCPTNPYGASKLMVEQMLNDMCRSNAAWQAVILRYFNPVGAHHSGLIGEDPDGEPNNLMPYIAQVAVGRRDRLRVLGNDYPTEDGTGVRDYIHVDDLAEGHVAALFGQNSCQMGAKTFNLGTGVGVSVLEMIRAFEEAAGVKIPYEIVERRSGDVAVSLADATKANQELGWAAQHGLERMCADFWRWQKMNPLGFQNKV